MIKNLFKISALIIILPSCGLQIQDGPFVIYYENGSIKGEGIYKNGFLDGKYLSYYKNGKVKHNGNYNNGQLNGVNTYYYKNGQIQKEENNTDSVNLYNPDYKKNDK